MAWWSLYKWFILWRKAPYTNMISMYRAYLYDEWFNSLSDEDKHKVEEYQKHKEEKRKKELFSSLLMIKAFVDAYEKFTI